MAGVANTLQGRRHTCFGIATLLIAASIVALGQSRSSGLVGVVSGIGNSTNVHVSLLRDDTLQAVQRSVTEARGRFQFVGLTAGSYILEFSAEGRKTQRMQIQLRPDSTLYVSTTLVVAGSDQAAGRIEISDDDVWYGTNFTKFARTQLPSGRNVWSLLQGQEPSTVTNRFDVGGTEAAIPALFSAFGASWTENQYRINGLDVTDPYTPGLPLINPDFDALSEFQAITASKPALSNGSGESISLASPSGSDNLRGSVAMFGSGGGLQSDNMSSRLQKFDFPGPLRLNSLLDGSAQLGGALPIAPLPLPLFASVSSQQVSQNLGGFNAPINSGVNRVLIDFSPLSNRLQQVDVLYSAQHVFNSSQSAMPTMAPEATTRGNDNFNQFQAHWSRFLSSSTLLTADFGAVNAILSSAFQPGTQGISTVDLPLLVFTGPAPLATSGLRTVYEAGGTLQAMLKGPLGTHNVSLGFDWDRGNMTERWYAMNNAGQVLVNGQGSEWILWNTPAHSSQYVQNVAEFVQDSWHPWKWLTLPIGLRIDTSTGQANGANNGIHWTTVQPRLGFVTPVWVPGLELQGSWSRYGHVLQGRYFDFGNPAALGSQIFRWQDLNGDGVVQPNEIGPLLRVWGGPYSAIDPHLARPYTDEFTFGVQETIPNLLTASVRFLRRDDHRLIALENTGVPLSQYTPVPYADPGNDGVYGTADDQVLTLYNEKPSALGNDFLVLSNSGFKASYKGVEAYVIAHVRNSWQFSAGFTAGQTLARTSPGNSPLQNDTGAVWSLAINPNTLVMSQGRTYFDRGYMGKLAGYYSAPHGFYLAAVATYFDGAPFGRLLFVNGFNQGPFFVRATPVGHPGGFQTQLNASIDMRLARDFHVGTSIVSAYCDVFNIMNWSRNTQESALTGPTFLLRVPLAVEAPRTMRLGVVWRFQHERRR
jgi:hypothetical protein